MNTGITKFASMPRDEREAVIEKLNQAFMLSLAAPLEGRDQESVLRELQTLIENKTMSYELSQFFSNCCASIPWHRLADLRSDP